MSIVFSKDWFEIHQSKLLWFANTWFGRWILCINGEKSKVGTRKIVKIEPGAIFWPLYAGLKDKRGLYHYQAEFRTNDKFARRLFHAFKPFWYFLHFLDWLALDRLEFLQKWSFGFSTLTAYPQSGNAGTYVNGSPARAPAGESFATIQAGAGTNMALDGSQPSLYAGLIANATSNQYNQLYRYICSFDTSSLTSGATITAGVLSLYDNGKANGLGSDSLDVVASTPGDAGVLVAADYTQLGSTSFANIAYASWSASAYNDFTLDSNGRSNISKTGISKFGARIHWDLTASFGGAWSSGQGTYYIFAGAATSGTSQDPKLVVTYSTNTAWTQSAPETVTLVANATKSTTRRFTDVIALVLSFLARNGYGKICLESVTIVANFTRTIGKSLRDTVTLVVNAVKGVGRSFSNVITIVVTLIFAQVYARILTEHVSLVLTLLSYLNGFKVTNWRPQSKTSSTWTPRDHQ